MSRDDKNETKMIAGGGKTSAIIIKISTDKYKKLPTKIKSTKVETVYDISNYGVAKQNNADKTVLRFIKNNNERLIFQLDFYQQSNKTVYSIKYKFDMNKNNMNYKIFDQLKKHLLYYSFFTYLEN